MAPAAIASSASRFGSPVLMPTRTLPTSTISQVWRYLRAAFSLSESHTRLPGSLHPVRAPVLGQAAVTTPPSSCTSARKRW